MDTKSLLEQLLESGKRLAEQGLAQGSEWATQGKEAATPILEKGKEAAAPIIEKGKELAEQGLDYASKNFGLPPAGPERDKVLKKLGIGVAAGSLMALLLGTKSGRKLLSPAAKLGSLAALGGLGYKVYTEWLKTQGGETAGQSIAALTDESANARSMTIIKAIIAAAKSDGTIDAEEQQVIVQHIKDAGMEESLSNVLMTELQKPLDVAEIVAEVDSPEAAVEVYLASLLMTDKQSEAEQSYLGRLAKALKLDASLVQSLEAEALATA